MCHLAGWKKATSPTHRICFILSFMKLKTGHFGQIFQLHRFCFYLYVTEQQSGPAQVSYIGSNLSTQRCQLPWHPKMPCASTVLGLLCSSIDDSVQQPVLTTVQIRWHIFISHETRPTVCIRELRTPQMVRTRNPNYPSMPGNLITNMPPHRGRAEQPSHPAERLSESYQASSHFRIFLRTENRV